MAINEVDTALTVEREDAELCIPRADHSVAVAQIFAFVTGVTEVTVLRVPPVVGVFAVLICSTYVVCDG